MIEGLIFAASINGKHGSLCMDEVVVTEDGRVMLCELGEEVLEPKRSSGMATPYWMSPEEIKGETITAKSDVWSLGTYVWELIEREPPYMEFPPLKALFFIQSKGVAELKQPELVSDELKAFLARCFVKDPEKRASFEELAQVCCRQNEREEGKKASLTMELMVMMKTTKNRTHFSQRPVASQSLLLLSRE